MYVEKNIILAVSLLFVTISTISLVILLRLASILGRPRPEPKSRARDQSPAHILVVLGSGGHTTEMFNILSSIDLEQFKHRTYLVSSGDAFSAQKARSFERTHGEVEGDQSDLDRSTYTVVTVRRARRVHQSFFTTPFTAMLSFWDCLCVMRGLAPGQSSQSGRVTTPDLILTNGPGTGVCVVMASICLAFFTGATTRSIFVESWARVRSLSLSGKILRYLVDRFLVQWPDLAGGNIEYIGPLVS